MNLSKKELLSLTAVVTLTILAFTYISTGGFVNWGETVHIQLSNHYKETGENDKWHEHLSRAIEDNNQNPVTLNEMGLFYSQSNSSNDNHRALPYFDRSISIDSSIADVHANRGVIHHRIGELELAISDFDNAIALDPKHKDAWLHRSIVLKKLERYQEALFSIDKYLRLEPLASEKWITKGILLLQLDQAEEALKAFNQGITIESKVGLYYFERAICFERLEMMIGAQDDINKSISLGYTERSYIAERILTN